MWTNSGRWWAEDADRPRDLIEETPASEPRPFSYDACPTHEDGRRRAVTRDGREVVLLCDDGPHETYPVVGYMPADKTNGINEWRADGRYNYSEHEGVKDLLVPPPPKRVVWVNLYEDGHASYWRSEEEADANWDDLPTGFRLGSRAYRIEID